MKIVIRVRYGTRVCKFFLIHLTEGSLREFEHFGNQKYEKLFITLLGLVSKSITNVKADGKPFRRNQRERSHMCGSQMMMMMLLYLFSHYTKTFRNSTIYLDWDVKILVLNQIYFHSLYIPKILHVCLTTTYYIIFQRFINKENK